MTFKIPYGCDTFGRLTRVMLHRPGSALRLINRQNYRHWLFDHPPDIGQFIEEHDRYRELLAANGVEVFELGDYVNSHHELIPRLPNLTYLHDTAVISSRGAMMSAMAREGRRHEERVVREALTNLGIPILTEFDNPHHAFEGCLLLSPETILIAKTERHNQAAIDSFISHALNVFPEIICVDVPQARRYMHPDTIFNRLSRNLALVYLPAFKRTRRFTERGAAEIDFAREMQRRGMELISVSSSEQRRLACSFVPLEPGVIMHYDTALDKETRATLSQKGVEIIFFHPEAITAGGGSLRCLTLRLHRASPD